jgi:hypothetical protein
VAALGLGFVLVACTHDFGAFSINDETSDGSSPPIDGSSPPIDGRAPTVDGSGEAGHDAAFDAAHDAPQDAATGNPTILCGHGAPCTFGTQQCNLCGMQTATCVATGTTAHCGVFNTALEVECDDSTQCTSGICCVTSVQARVVQVTCASSQAACTGDPLCLPSDPASCNKTCSPANGALMNSGYDECR